MSRVALATAGDLGLDVRLGHRRRPRLGDLRQHQQHLHALLGLRPELGVEVGLGLVGDLDVGLLGDALPGEARPELVVHDLGFLVDEDLGQLEGRVGDGVVDDLVGELVARLVEGVALEPSPDVVAKGRQLLEVAELRGEVVVERGQAPSRGAP